MAKLLIPLLAATVAALVGMLVLFLLAPLVYGELPRTDSFVRFASLTLLGLAVGVFSLVRRSTNISGSSANRLAAAVTPRWPTTPVQRIFLLAAILGTSLCALAITLYYSDGNSQFIEHVAFERPYYYKSYFYFFWSGFVVAILGYFGAFHYELTFGRLGRWVKGG